MLTFAVPDLHGRHDLLVAAIAAIEAHADTGKVVFLGDYVDRGPEAADVLERLIAGPSPGWRWICLKGNHEAIMALALRNPERLDWWIENGGDATVRSYGERRELIAHHLPWVEALAAIHVDTHRVFVHAGVDPAMPLEHQADKTLLWKRYSDDDSRGHGHRHLVHGHNPNVDGPLRLSARTALDTLAWKTGRLVIGIFEDTTPGGPIDLIEVTRAAA